MKDTFQQLLSKGMPAGIWQSRLWLGSGSGSESESGSLGAEKSTQLRHHRIASVFTFEHGRKEYTSERIAVEVRTLQGQSDA